MNPLYRRMFQQPGVSRQPMGILASSPELANAAQQRQPVRMAQGGMNTTTFTSAVQRAIQAGDRYALQELADPNNYGEAAKTQDGQNAIKMAAQAINRAASNNPPVQISTAPTVAVADDPESFDFAMPRTSTDPDLIDKGIASVNEFFYGTDTKQTPIQTGLRAVDSGVRAVTGSAAELMSGNFMRPVTDYLTTPQLKGTAAEQSDRLTDPSMLLPQTGETPTPVSPLVSDALNYKNMYGTGDLNLGETLAATTTPTQNKAAADAGESTDNPFGVNKKAAVSEGDKKPNVNRKKLDNLLKQAEAGTLVTGGKAVKLTPDEAATPEAATALSMVLPAKTSLSEMEKQAKEIMGFDPSKAKENKSASFWRNLTMAGLAIAAGESENALTNVAKGLMVGMDSYSKDIKDLNEMEAEERKEYRATLRDLVKTDKDEKIALATMQNNFNYRLADLNQKRDQFKSDADYKQQELRLRESLANRQLEAGLIKDIADIELRQGALDETKSQNIITNRMDKLKALPDFVKNAAEIGYGTIDDKGNFSWTDKGKAWVEQNASAVLKASITGSTKTGKVAPTREAYILDSLGKEFALDAARQDLASQGIKNPTGDQLREYFGRQHDATISGSASTTAAPAATDPANAPAGTRFRDPDTGLIVVKQADGSFAPEATGN
jgi:hypothetical protein